MCLNLLHSKILICETYVVQPTTKSYQVQDKEDDNTQDGHIFAVTSATFVGCTVFSAFCLLTGYLKKLQVAFMKFWGNW